MFFFVKNPESLASTIAYNTRLLCNAMNSFFMYLMIKVKKIKLNKINKKKLLISIQKIPD